MKEIEILIAFDDSEEEVLNKFSKFKFIEEKEIYDVYYVDKLRKNLKPEEDLRLNEIFRVRKHGESCLITYKKNHFEEKGWTYSDEYETKADSFITVEKIIEMLGLEELITLHNKRKIYHHKDYEIILEEVVDLGLFIEVEKVVDDSFEDVMKVKNEIKNFIRSLELTNVKELNVGKNQIMLARRLNRNLNLYIVE